jgi:hypothetical protein
MELFFMLTATLALIVPIAIGRIRCVRISPRLLHLFKCVLPPVALRARPLSTGAQGLLSDKPGRWPKHGAFSALVGCRWRASLTRNQIGLISLLS